MKKVLKIFCLTILLMSSACVNRMTDFTLISTKNSNIQVKKLNRVEGSNCANLIFGFIPIGTFQPNLKEAIDNAIEKNGGGELLVDGVVYSKLFWIPLVFSRYCYAVEGTLASPIDSIK